MDGGVEALVAMGFARERVAQVLASQPGMSAEHAVAILCSETAEPLPPNTEADAEADVVVLEPPARQPTPGAETIAAEHAAAAAPAPPPRAAAVATRPATEPASEPASEPATEPAAAESAPAPLDQLALVRRERAARFRARPPREVEPPPAVAAPSVAMLSFNVWFEHEHTWEHRMRAIAALCTRPIDDGGPALLAFQELTPHQAAMLQPPLLEAGFRPMVLQCPLPGYGVGLACRAPLGAFEHTATHQFFNSQMGRALVWGRSVWPGVGPVVVGVVHLESFVRGMPQVGQARREQLREATRVLTEKALACSAQAALLMGDFNWDDKKDGSAHAVVAPGWLDAWELAGRPTDAQFTYDGRANQMLTNRFQNRFDRCMLWLPDAPPADATAHARCDVRSGGGGGSPTDRPAVRVSAFQLVGTTPIQPGLTLTRTTRAGKVVKSPLLPSDHFGVLTSLRCDQEAGESTPPQPSAMAAWLARSGLKRPRPQPDTNQDPPSSFSSASASASASSSSSLKKQHVTHSPSSSSSSPHSAFPLAAQRPS